MDRLRRIYQNIKEVKIQGATNVAKAALTAYNLKPTNQTKKELLSLRPTEPMLAYVLKKADSLSSEEIITHFSQAQKKINQNVLTLIRSGNTVYTHCHSTNVINALLYAKKQGRKFRVFNTETRPLFQGRITANELRKAKIPVTLFID